ncbi:MAG TPA: hypothetical protein P5341_16130, partial [Hyphomonas sp.]|nr:hypothetical protein [Hyphomonas sp.]
MVAEAAASVPLVTAHEAAAALIRRPMPDLPGAAFLEGVYTQLQLAGNAFLEAVRCWARRRGSRQKSLKSEQMAAWASGFQSASGRL